MITRRNVIRGGLGLALCPTCATAPLAQGFYAGCTLPSKHARDILGRSLSMFAYKADAGGGQGSGNPDFDRALAKTLVRLSDMFAVLPGFIFNENTGRNAYATKNDELGNREDGTVIFGKPLFREIMGRPENPHIGIAAVCAHEFAHVLQFKLGVQKLLISSNRRVKRLELHADFLAGYFAGRRKLERADFPAVTFASTQYSSGDGEFGMPGHHGTAQERGAAVVAGFNSAYRARESFGAALETGINYVMTIPG
jgi:hypothetical protein